MSLKDAFQKAAVTAFKVTDSVTDDIRYDSYVTAVHNTSTGTLEPEYNRYMVSVVFEEYSTQSIDGINIHAGDRKALVPVLNLPIVPSSQDMAQVLEEGVWRDYSVIDKSTDPADSLWTIQMRHKG